MLSPILEAEIQFRWRERKKCRAAARCAVLGGSRIAKKPAINQLFPQEVASCQKTCCSLIIWNLNKNQPQGFKPRESSDWQSYWDEFFKVDVKYLNIGAEQQTRENRIGLNHFWPIKTGLCCWATTANCCLGQVALGGFSVSPPPGSQVLSNKPQTVSKTSSHGRRSVLVTPTLRLLPHY